MTRRILAALAALATHARVLNIASDCGAVGDNATLNTAALSACVARAAPGDTLLVPRGVFLTGKVALRARTTLRFADGGWLQGSASAADYGDDWDSWHVVSVVNASGVTIVADSRGGGGIAGPMWQMIAGWNTAQQMYTPRPWSAAGCYDTCRPMNLGVVDSDGVTLRDFVLRDSASWTTLLRRSSDALLDGLLIRGSRAWPNGDGLDVESGTNIVLQNLDISTGDDAIAMRSGNCNAARAPWPRPIMPLRGVRVRNCTLASSSAAIKVENLFQADHGPVSDVDVDGVTVRDSNRGIGVWQRVAGPSGGRMSNLSFRNADIETRYMFGTAWWGSGEALVVTTVPENPAQMKTGLPGIFNVTFENVSARAEGGCLFSSRGQAATAPRALDALALRNVSIVVGVSARHAAVHAELDFRPVDAGGGAPNVVPSNVTGIVFEGAVGATIDGRSRVVFEGPPRAWWAGAGGGGVCVAGAVGIAPGFACEVAGQVVL